MNVECHNVTSAELERYRQISIAYRAETRFRVDRPNDGLDGLHLVEEPLPESRYFDYDAHHELGVFRWERWNLENWRIFYAIEEGTRIGGAVGAWKTEDVNMLEDREDLACVWDLRIDEPHRGQGIGRILVHAIAAWATDNGCVELKIETDNYNTSACRFYAAIGCELRSIQKSADPGWPDEYQLLWYLDLPLS